MRATRDAGRDEILIAVASTAPAAEFDAIAGQIAVALKDEIGVRIDVRVVAPGALDADTEIHTSPKPKRFRDER